MTETDRELAIIRDLYQALDQKFGRDIVMLDIRGISALADYFVIATGGSALQIQALAAAAEESLGKNGCILRHSEGMGTNNWVLLDFGDIIVHLFDKDSRAFYSLERVWGDAKMITC